jgi:hypothetical protein
MVWVCFSIVENQQFLEIAMKENCTYAFMPTFVLKLPYLKMAFNEVVIRLETENREEQDSYRLASVRRWLADAENLPEDSAKPEDKAVFLNLAKRALDLLRDIQSETHSKCAAIE